MILNFKQVIVLYSLLCANFWKNANFFVESESDGQPNNVKKNSLCYEFKEQLATTAKRLKELQKNTKSIISEINKLKMLREKIYGVKGKSPPNILEVKCANDRLPSNCNEIDAKCQNQLYRVAIAGISFPVSCDFKTEHGTWTVIQRRQDGSVNFFRNWTDYVHGFGDVDGEFFIGLEKLHALTMMGAPQELYVMLEDFKGVRGYAKYNTCQVDSAATDYKLTVHGFSGDVDDNMAPHSGRKFSTWDRNNENGCSKQFKGGWWYADCFGSNLNGPYVRDLSYLLDSDWAVHWNGFTKWRETLKFTQMMIRPRKN